MAASKNLDIISALEILLIPQESFFSFFMGWLMFNFERTVLLAHFMPLFSFYSPWKHEETVSFLMFSEGIEIDQWYEMG